MRPASCVVLVPVLACTIAAGCEPVALNKVESGTPRSSLQAAAAVGRSGATVSFSGGSVDVPAGAVDETRDFHARPADAAPSAALAEVTRPLTPAIALDLSGAQPSRPLVLTLAVDRLPPSDVGPEEIFLATAPSSGEPPKLVPARYDRAERTLRGEVDHLSVFWGVWIHR